MPLTGPDCKKNGHCQTCVYSVPPTCCECGEALVPWHPEIEDLYKDEQAMSTPMYDLPEHLKMGLTKNHEGPVDPPHPDFDHWGCWCGDKFCTKWRKSDDG